MLAQSSGCPRNGVIPFLTIFIMRKLDGRNNRLYKIKDMVWDLFARVDLEFIPCDRINLLKEASGHSTEVVQLRAAQTHLNLRDHPETR